MIDLVLPFLSPSGLMLISLVGGLAVLPARRFRKAALVLLSSGGLVFLIFGSGPVSFWLAGRLEHRFEALDVPPADAKAIVVLAGAAEIRPHAPVSAHANDATAMRLLEAARLSLHAPRLPIVVSGHGPAPGVMQGILESIGIPGERIVRDDESASTWESAENVRALLGPVSIVLVTSAGHMERAAGAFRRAGLRPVPAPTHFLTRRNILATGYLPTSSHLALSDLAVREHAGLLWYRARGRWAATP